ncbi:small VCP/p97-interacting protein isoform X1 [Paramormyrops kingsleyae]|uniref:small VCP/p97-interacting protein isoform X1 n=1 Tax=Paramormyrops kingsleyae TaxID=1676925 RepID=UPI003B97846F
MGMCLPCLGGAADDVVETPDPETRRRQLAEAAEKRQKEISVGRTHFAILSPRAHYRPPVVSRRPTEELKTQSWLRGRRRNRRRWRNRK